MNDQANSDGNIDALKLGPAFRLARERMGLGVAAAAAELRIPSRVIEHLEAGRFSDIGAAVFVRGYVRSYGRFLGLSDSRCKGELEGLPVHAPQLASRQQHSRLRLFTDRYAMRSAYVVLTLAIVLPALYVATHYAPLDPLRSVTHSLDAAEVSVALPGQEHSISEPAIEIVDRASHALPAVPIAMNEHLGAQPVMASMAPFYRPIAEPIPAEASMQAVMGLGWTLHFVADSWVEIVDRSGNRLVYGMVRRGETLNYASGAILRVALGNASGVQVSRDGSPIDLTTFKRANVARFAVSSAGELEPVGG